MYNYKFDNDIIDEVVSKCNISIKKGEIDDLVKKVNKINSQLFFDENICNCQNIESKMNNSNNSRMIVVNNIDAFDNADIESFGKVNEDYSRLLNSIEFELKILLGQKQKLLKELKMIDAIKIADKISELNEKVSRIELEITNFNKDIISRESDYVENFNNFLGELKSKDNIDIDYFNEKYNQKVIDNYKKNQILHIFENYFASKEKEEIINALANDNIKVALNNNYDYIYNRFIGNVGKNI